MEIPYSSIARVLLFVPVTYAATTGFGSRFPGFSRRI
jgi:hypothetical protein